MKLCKWNEKEFILFYIGSYLENRWHGSANRELNLSSPLIIFNSIIINKFHSKWSILFVSEIKEFCILLCSAQWQQRWFGNSVIFYFINSIIKRNQRRYNEFSWSYLTQCNESPSLIIMILTYFNFYCSLDAFVTHQWNVRNVMVTNNKTGWPRSSNWYIQMVLVCVQCHDRDLTIILISC